MSNQLIKTTELGKENVFPRTRILDLFDDTSGLKLIDILNSFNMMFVPYLGNKSYTRNQISPELRRQGLWLTYVIDNTVYTEWYDEVAIDDTNWGSDSNWRQGSNALVGDLSISPNGTWVINGEDSGITIKGDKGDSPVIRIYDNKILVSYDKGVTYEDLNNTPVYTKFRFNSLTNTYLVSYDLGANWEDISDEKVYHKFKYNLATNTYLESTDFGKTWSNISAEKVYTKFRFNRSTNTYQVSTDLGLNWTDISSDKVYYQFRYNEETNTHLVSTDFGTTWTNVSEDKVFYLFRTEGNRLLVSTDLGTTWENCSEPIAAWFRWADVSGTGNIGKVLISRDLLTWSDLSPTITNNLYIKGYVSTVGELPTSSAAIGDIYMVGPTYAESDTTHDYPHYRMWIKLSSGWVDNGEYQSNILIVLTTGLDTGITMSLKAITDALVTEKNRILELETKVGDLSTNKLNKIYFDNEHEMPFILEAFTKNTDNSYSVEYVSYNNETFGTSCWLRDKNNAQIVLVESEIYNKKLFFMSRDYSIFIVIDVELIQEDKQSGAFYNIALNSNIYNALNSPFINGFINKRDLQDNIIEQHTTKEKFTDLNITKGYLNNDGSFSANDAFFCSDFIELKGTHAILKNVAGSDYSNPEFSVIHFYNSNKENIENPPIREIKGSVNNLTYTNEAKYIRFFTVYEITTDLMSIEFDNFDILDAKILDTTNIDDFIDIKNTLIDWEDGVVDNKNILFGIHGKSSDILKIDRNLDIYVTNPCEQTTPEAFVPYFNKLIFFDENKTRLFKETKYNDRVLNREKIEIPSNARYIQFCFGEEDFYNVHIYVRIRDLIKYNAFKAVNVYNRDIEKRVDYDNISTPKYIDCCVGLPLSYFTDNLSNKKGYIDSVTNSNGTNSYTNNGGIYFRGRKLISYTAIEEKEESVTLHQIDTSNSKLSDEPPYAMDTIQKVITLRSIARNNGNGQRKSIMILGDSLIDQNISVQYIKELFGQDTDINVSFIGTRGTSPALHEGHSGWSCVDFISNNSPFYIDGTLSVKKYFDKNKEKYFNTSSTIDYVIIALGTNDIGQGVRMFNEDECLTIGNNMKKIVDLFLKDYPNAKIAVNLPSTSGLYSAYGCYSFFRMSMIRLRNVYISLFDNGAYNKNVTCVDSGSQISKEYGYDYESLPIDDIITDEILSGFKGGGGETNIHPNSKGYKQIGKAYYCKLRSWIAGNL